MKSGIKIAIIDFSVIASVFGAIIAGFIYTDFEPEYKAKISPMPGTYSPEEDIVFSGADSVPKKGSEIARYHWDFGDGSSETGSTAVHRYIKDSNYKVTLTVTDKEGRTRQDTAIIEVSDSAQQAVAEGKEVDPANLISISAIKPRQISYLVNQTAELGFTVTDEQNIPYNFTAYFIQNNETQITNSNSYEFTHSPQIWAEVHSPGVWQVKVVVEWDYEGLTYEKERNVFFRVKDFAR